jgi:hypothetical protein
MIESGTPATNYAVSIILGWIIATHIGCQSSQKD